MPIFQSQNWSQNIDPLSVPVTHSDTQYVLLNRDGFSRTVFTGTSFTYDGSFRPTGGTIVSMRLEAISDSTVLQTMTGLDVGLGDLGSLINTVDSLRDQITWFNVVSGDAFVSFSPTQILLQNTDGTFTEAIGSGFSIVGPPVGTVTGLRHLAANGITVLHDIAGLNVSLGIGAAALFDEVASMQFYALAGQGDDTLQGFGAQVPGTDLYYNNLNSTAGNDTLIGQLGPGITANGVQYSELTSAVFVDLAAGTVTGGHGTDTLTNILGANGTAFNDTMSGHAGGSVLFGSEGDDTLTGLGGTDFLDGGAGDDTLNGGGGTDTASYAVDLNTGVVVSLSISDPQNTGGAGTDTLTGIENLTGSNFSDYLTGDGGNNGLNGGFGDDYLYGLGGDDNLQGDIGNDAVYGGDGNDTIDTGNLDGGAAANYVEASYGIDSVVGGSGSDVIYGGADNDNLVGGGGNDVVSGDHGVDALFGGAGVDLLYVDSTDTSVSGGADADYLVVNDAVVGVNISATDIENWFGYDNGDTFTAIGAGTLVYMRGAGGADLLTGGLSGDWLYGDGGNDTVSGGNGNDVLFGGDGTDQLYGGDATDLLYVDHFDNGYDGGSGSDYLVVQDVSDGLYNIGLNSIEYAYGFSANDTISAVGANVLIELHGGDGHDVLSGGSGVNILLGEAGNDTITGGTSTDHIVGGADADMLMVSSNGGTDYFYDFQDGDNINVHNVGITQFSELTIDNTYAGSNWYGVGYGTGTLWVNTGGGALDGFDFTF